MNYEFAKITIVSSLRMMLYSFGVLSFRGTACPDYFGKESQRLQLPGS